MERIVTVLPEAVGTYVEWKKLVLAHGVMGVQVHDARLVAAMNVHGVRRLLSLNKADFARYSGLIVQTPDEVNAAGAAGS